MRFRFKQLALCLVLFTTGFPALALPQTTLEWVQQTGTSSSNESIEIWVRLSVAVGASGPLILDGATTASFSASDLIAYSRVDEVLQSGFAVGGFDCGVSPYDSCGATPEWTFSFNQDPATSFFPFRQPAAPLTLNPGESKDYLFGTFAPRAGSVAPGTYYFRNAGFLLYPMGLDVNGNAYDQQFDLAQTCASNSINCMFNRTITAVPEPDAFGMMVGGLAFLGSLVKRRKFAGAPLKSREVPISKR